MFFKSNKDKSKCKRCEGNLKEEFSFCPYCGCSLITKEEMEKDYGLLGKNDAISQIPSQSNAPSGGLTDKLINSMFNMVLKNLNQQVREDLEGAEISSMPNGIKISLGQPIRKKQPHPKIVKKIITEDQLKRIASLPRKEAKSTITRLPDKIVYELTTPGVSSVEDIFISKLESGYEIKALGQKSMYANSLAVNLPLKAVGLDKNKVIVEFLTHHNEN